MLGRYAPDTRHITEREDILQAGPKKINREKSKTGRANQAKFLGFCFPGKTIRWTTDALEDFKHRIRKLTARSWGISMDDRITKLNEYLRGWMGYFGISQHWTPIEPLDQWIRRRLRMCMNALNILIHHWQESNPEILLRKRLARPQRGSPMRMRHPRRTSETDFSPESSTS